MKKQKRAFVTSPAGFSISDEFPFQFCFSA